jgi:monoamine oxidase
VLRGKRFAMSDFKEKKVSLPYDGTTPGILFGQERRYAERLLEKIQDPNRLPPELLALDNKSVAEVLLAEGPPEDVVSLYTYLNATERTARPDQMSALSLIRSLHSASGFDEEADEGRIFGGNDQVPKALARYLGDDVLYNRPVKQIRHDSDGVEITFDEDGKQQTMRGARLVIAMPFSVLRKLDIQPAFSASKMSSIESVSYGTVMKLAMQYQRRFWDETGSIGQRVLTDTPLRRIYHHSIDQPGPSGILLSFTAGEDADKLGQLSPEERLTTARQVVDDLWTGADQHWLGGFTKFWNEDPYTQGSYSYTGLGQAGYVDRARVPEGLVHFAGEHTSKHRATMNGAIESGQRVAREILEAGPSATG